MAASLELRHDGNPILVHATEAVLGRTRACTVRVVHPLVSREHCRIRLTPRGVFLEDCGSSNGTYLNGQAVEGEVKLKKDDVFTLGRTGPELRLLRAELDGADLASPDGEEMLETMVAGDPRAARFQARVSVAAEALPALSEVLDEPSTRLASAAVGDGSDEDDEEPPTEAVGPLRVAPPDDDIPVASKILSESDVRAFEQPVRQPTQEPEPESATVPVELTARPTPARKSPAPPAARVARPTDQAPENRAETQPLPPAEAPKPRSRFVPGLLVGLLLGVTVVVAAALWTDLPEFLREQVTGTSAETGSPQGDDK